MYRAPCPTKNQEGVFGAQNSEGVLDGRLRVLRLEGSRP